MSHHHENNLLVRLLYGEDPDQEPERRDAEFQKSYRQMAGVKSRLDRRPPQCPAPEVIDRVVDYAGTRAGGNGVTERETEQRRTEASTRRNERPPAQRGAKRPLYSVAGAVAVGLVVIGLGWWQFTEVAQPPTDMAVVADQSRQESAETESPAAQRAAAGDFEATDAQATDAQATAAGAAGTSAAHVSAADARVSGTSAASASAADTRASSREWNRADDVYEVYRRIEMIRARGQAAFQPAAASGDGAAAHVTSTN